MGLGGYAEDLLHFQGVGQRDRLSIDLFVDSDTADVVRAAVLEDNAGD